MWPRREFHRVVRAFHCAVRAFHRAVRAFHRVEPLLEEAFQNKGREDRGGSREKRRETREQWRVPHRSRIESWRESHSTNHPREEREENAERLHVQLVRLLLRRVGDDDVDNRLHENEGGLAIRLDYGICV